MLEGANGPVRGRAAHRRRIALLALLASSRGRPVARERLIGLLWPEHPGDAARHLLSESLYVLRKALGDKAFVAVGDEVALDPRVVGSDAGEFEAAVDAGDPARAVGLYRGPFLDGFYLSDADEFERWVEGERSRLARVYAQALERLAEAAEEGYEFLEAAGWWRRLIAHDPYSSRVVLRLMRALESGGEHAAALFAATEHVEFLREDLGAQPDPAVPAYAERLRTAPAHGSIPLLPELPAPALPAPALPERGPVPESEGGGSPPPVPPPAPVVPDAARGLPARARRLGVRIGAAGLLGLAATLAGVGIMALQSKPQSVSAAPGQDLDPHHIAVLYFEDNTPGDTLRHIANDLTARIIDDLAQVSSLRVVSINGVRPFRDTALPLDSIARALGVGTVVAGDVQGSGDRIRVVVRLLDPVNGRQLASRPVVRKVGDLLALEDEVVRQVADFLRPLLGREIRLRERSAGTRSAEARELLLRGQQRWEDATGLATGPNPLNLDAVRGMLGSADSLLAEAARRDRRWGEPLIMRGWVALSSYDVTPTGDRPALFVEAVELADRALAREPENAAALELRGTARWRMVQLGAVPAGATEKALSAAAEADLNAALARDPSLAHAWATLSQLLRVQEGRLADADQAARHALESDEFLADAPLIMERLYRSSVQLARFDSASAWCDRGRRRFPNDWAFVECRLTLLGYEGSRPDVQLAWGLVRELEQMDPPDAARRKGRDYTPVFRRMLVARVAARAGLADSARALVMAARAQVQGDPVLESSQAADEAYVRLLLAEPDSAVVLLERHLAVQPRLRAQVARNVKFRSLHSDPRFRRLVAGAPARER